MIATIVTLLGGWRAAAFAVALLVVAGYAGTQTYRLHSAQTELAQLQASVAEAEAKAQSAARVESERRDTSSSSATQTMLDYLSHNLPAIETRTHDTIERIRTVYRDRPAICPDRPDSVQRELDAARARANGAATGGLPARSPGTAATGAAARAADGRMGSYRNGDHRDSSHGVDRRVAMHGQAQGGSSDPLTRIDTRADLVSSTGEMPRLGAPDGIQPRSGENARISRAYLA